MSDLIQDLRFAIRTLLKQPAFGVTVLAMLALGIGANTAIFGVFNGFFLRPLPFPDPQGLVRFDVRAPRWNLDYVGMAYPDFHFWRERSRTFQGMAVAGGRPWGLSGEGDAERIQGATVTHDMAEVLGIQPLLGRDFVPEDDQPGAPDIVMIAEGLWEERWGRDPDILGRTIRLDARPFTIVGVMPDQAAFVLDSRVWTPLRADLEESSGNYYLFGLGRLKDGTPLETALADLERIHGTLKEEGMASEDTFPVLEPVLDRLVGDARGPLLALMASVGLLLMIACGNVAGIMLARALGRQKEVGIRVALGAGRGRIVRQLLTESLTLAALGGVMGGMLGIWGSSGLMTLSPEEPPSWVSIQPDLRFFLFVLAIVGLTAVLSGLAPALTAAVGRHKRIDLDSTTRATGSRGQRRGLQLLVVGEVALSVILLVVAGLGVRDFRAVSQVNPGFEVEGVLTFELSLPSAKYETHEAELAFWEEYLNRVQSLPGVTATGTASAIPLGGHWGQFFRPEGAPDPDPDEVLPVTLNRVVSPGYLEAMGVRLLSGRYFNEGDGRDEGSRAVILNESWARANFPNEDPIGKRIRASWEGASPMTVVGVTADTKHYGLDEETRQGIFQPLAQDPISHNSIVVRTSLDPTSLVPQIRQLTRDVDPDIPVVQPETMREILDQSLWPRKMVAWLFSGFAAMALILAIGGLYGVLSYTVTQRRLEIGIRMALGAQHRKVLVQILRSGMTLVAVGSVLGLAGAYAMARAVSSIFFGAGVGSPTLYLGVASVLLIVGALANLIPARKAARVSPVGALRSGE